MNCKKLITAAAAVFVALILTELLFHTICLKDIYDSLAGIGPFRPYADIMGYTWVMIVQGLIYSFFFVFIFARGYEGRGLMEGVRFAIYITLFFNVVMAYMQFVLYAIPYYLVWYWILMGFVQNLIYGILAALIYKPKPQTA
jgi:hypothetical protein